MLSFSGRTLGRYQIVERLGSGGMADVYKAYDPQLGRYVAIKVISPSLQESDPLSNRIAQEARSLASFSHPNIVQIFDIGEEDGILYLVLEYVGDGILANYTGRPVAYQDAIRWLLPVARALEYAHQNGIVHRDVKPANILLRKGQPVLSDFGVSKALNRDRTLAKAALGFGTPLYMSPEQLKGQEVDARTDIYSLGVVLFELLTGFPPFQADNPLGVGMKHITELPPRLQDLVPSIPDSLQAIIDRALAKNPADRYLEMREMITDLERAADGINNDSSTSNSGVDYIPGTTIAYLPNASGGSIPPNQTIGPPIGAPGGYSGWVGGDVSSDLPAQQRSGSGSHVLIVAAIGVIVLCILVMAASIIVYWPSIAGSGGEPVAAVWTSLPSPTTLSTTSAASPTAAPTSSATSSQAGGASTPGSIETVPAPDAGGIENQVEQFMKSYYDAVNRRDYQTSWMMLSDNFKATGRDRDDFDMYVDWWNTFESVELLSVQAEVVNPQRKIINATVRLRYHSIQRGVIEEQYTYRVIFDENLARWLIDQ